MENGSPTPEKRTTRQQVIRRRRILALCAAAVALVLIVLLLVLLVRGIVGTSKKTQTEKPEGFSQIGPELPASPTDIKAFVRLYDYAAPVPESASVSDDYFVDALFIGDSRTQGLFSNSAPGQADMLASVYVNTGNAATYEFSYGDGTSTLGTLLASKPYTAVYINLGMNELGWQYPETYIEYYGALIDTIRAAQPLTMIYLQSLLPVSASQSSSSDYYNNTRIDDYNARVQALAKSKSIYYLDVAAAYKDESGAMPSGKTTDGINLTTDSFDIWHTYLKTHTVTKESYDN